ncbi:MAG: methionyl-tRNA formyltransferase [Acidobacteria bacterium]|nr:methionyl-tRNA formyltransferase [Acidobacteriota bacterium]
MRSLRVAFFGTPAFALTTLERIAASAHPIVLVVTQPDRPRGRGQRVLPSPVKTFAAARGVPVLQPERLRDEPFLLAFDAATADIGVVAAYGRILPPVLLARPRLGMINVHASLLPRWRGAAPVHRAILAGDRETGVTIMRVAAALDAGPMLAQERVTIGQDETSAALEGRLADAGARLLVQTLDRLAEGPVAETPQPEDGITYASRLERQESRIDWGQPARQVHDRIRGLQPWPMATVMLHGRRLRIVGSSIGHEDPSDASPGTVVKVTPDAFEVAAAAGTVRVTTVQPEGKTPMSVRQFLLGHTLSAGDRLDPVPTG